MGSIFDYLDWRGDIPFSADPFNEVDNLILSELVYTNFENISDDGSILSLREACSAYFQDIPEEAEAANVGNIRKARLMKEMLKGERFRNTKVYAYVSELDPEENIQFAAATFLLDDGTAFAAIRGTDYSFTGWKETLNLSYLSETGGQRKAVEYLNSLSRIPGRPLRTGGHSKGGNFAIYGAAFCEPAVRNRIINIYANDAPGFQKEIICSKEYQEILPKIISIIPDSSVIGKLLYTESTPLIVRSSAFGFKQHDGYTWQVKRNRFERSEPSEIGKFIDKSVDDWSNQLDDETRASLVVSIFDLLESTGMDNFYQIKEKKRRAAEAVLSGIGVLPDDKRHELLQSLKLLLQSGKQNAADEIGRIMEKALNEQPGGSDSKSTGKLKTALRIIMDARKTIE